MCLGVTGRSRTGTSGSTAHGSAIELRPHPNTRLNLVSVAGLEPAATGPQNHARCHLRHTEMKLAPRRGFEPRTSWLTARRSAICAIGELNWCLVTDSNGRPAG